MVFNFFNLKNGEAVRIYYKYPEWEKIVGKQTGEEAARCREEYILKAPLDELFEFKQPTIPVPDTARTYAGKVESIACEICGELTPEHKIRIQDGKKVCLDCFKDIRPDVTGTSEQKWQRCIAFHGEVCEGLAIGFRVAEAVAEKLHLTFSEDAEDKIVCVTENYSCANDAFREVFKCSFGRETLIYRNTGKMVFTFFNRKTGEKVRIYCKNAGTVNDSGKEPEGTAVGDASKGRILSEQTKEEKRLRVEYILKAPLDEIFDFSQPKFEVPEKSRIFGNIDCALCGEQTREDKIQFQDGKKVCPDCFKGSAISIPFIASFSGCASQPDPVGDPSPKGEVPSKAEMKEITPATFGITRTYDDQKWQYCVDYYKRGGASGFRIAEAVIEKLRLTFSEDERLVFVAEKSG